MAISSQRKTPPGKSGEGETQDKKKVKPYPIPVYLGAEGPQRTKVDIKKLTQVGFIAEVGTRVYKVNEEYPCVFTIPASFNTVHATVKVLKTYDQYVGKQKDGSIAARLAEFHFVNLIEVYSTMIHDFLVRIKQM